MELKTGEDGIARCWWAYASPTDLAYHDHEWGMPLLEDDEIFERLSLEGFQSGLSWSLILRKRDNFRSAFAYFDVDKVAKFTEDDVLRLLQDAGIVRHRGKIEACINNARQILEVRKNEGSLVELFAPYFLQAIRNQRNPEGEIPTIRGASEESTAISKMLKKRGFKFVGPTTIYSLMQALGVVNDHLDGCSSKAKTQAAQDKWLQICEALKTKKAPTTSTPSKAARPKT